MLIIQYLQPKRSLARRYDGLLPGIMGLKKNKLKKLISPTPAEPSQHEPDDDLLEDLMAHLDSKNEEIQVESAQILNGMQSTQLQQARDDVSGKKQDSRSRYLARQAS